MCLNLQTKSLVTSDGRKYVYDHVPAQRDNSTVLLIHGYPATRHDWKNQVEDLSAAGYGVIAPDCLGYGDSDMPLEVEAYNLKQIGNHLMEILDKEGLDKVVGVGHDWGSNVLSRTTVWHPDRFEKLAFLSLGFTAPGIFSDIDALNVYGLAQLGYMQGGYFYFFNAYDAGELAASHLESLFSLAFPVDNSKWAEDLAGLGTARAWLTNDTTTELPKYLTEEAKNAWMAAYSKPNATEASMNYYKAILRGVQAKNEEALTDEDRTLRVPVLAIGGSQDLVTLADQIGMVTKPFAASGYTEKIVDAGHWMTYEDREGVKTALLDFLQK
ncbi:hypothetical protein F53441_13414 [Fusarium austroafricanum]|uniref:AB hydrolase-1 domain-containing protein n=1 Tax=Fusarium austroafricanum TaxID=2364996 RepID=A0A8H4JQX2_9HYPO|nr:hypothetical protein F53441_13414 [Fusarium austroafricanum]